MPLDDFLLVCLIASLCGLVVTVVGMGALRLARHRPLSVALAAVSVVTVAAMAAGTVGVAQAMFLSSHDLTVMMVVCGVAAVLAVGVAAVLGRPVVADVRALQRAAHGLGSASSDGEPAAYQPPRPSSIAELADLSSELERTSARLTEARARERAVEQSRRELIAWISHDLRTPLAGLRAMAESLEDGVAADPARYHRRIRVEVDRLSGMVDDLFELSRIQAGALQLSLSRVSLYDLVGDALAGTEVLARSRSVRLEGGAIEPVPVRVDSKEMSRALTNLLVNAIRHTPSDGAVVVGVESAPDAVVVTVTDACGGIPEDDLHRVFDTGWRGSHARTPGPDGGAGLGLAIVRGIVEAHRGSVGVVNVTGGCRFEVRLPVQGPHVGALA
ncbi:sensor histidine kinase [Yinghuangia seranimata]|uniref:sensor histidine kinase n=1 Tax=Yinghuangia seranimata TaxID=408067 RepID=UPI00248C4A62|nr:HAMP domain-containing sensor histidine kinase [Yinghuangia seranimata]MDI2132598.1 HAMP domain-containing sensor histidine kinase [Yinghuangia seranimata]